jgi:hypothetical protein
MINGLKAGVYSLVMALSALTAGSAYADCSFPAGVEGEMVYNTTHKVYQFCDGTDWKLMAGWPGGNGCRGPSDCLNIGDQCSDSTIFAGCHPTQYWKLFLHPNNQSAGTTWNNGTFNYSVTGATDAEDGRANTALLAGLSDVASPYQAANTCANLDSLGYQDWYLPSQVEMYYLWSVHAAINAGPGDAFVATDYWTSTEVDLFGAYYQYFGSTQTGGDKMVSFDVRCIRRD